MYPPSRIIQQLRREKSAAEPGASPFGYRKTAYSANEDRGASVAPLLATSKEQFMVPRHLVACALMVCSLAAPPAFGSGQNELTNGSFEDSSGDPNTPAGWLRQAYVPGATLTWDSITAHDGLLSVRISNPTPNDTAWTQTVTLQPDRNYLLSGWIKTDNVAHTTQGVDAGANLCVWGTWQRSAPITGTNDWTYVRLVFNSGPTGTVTIGARVGYWAGVTSGTAWFDDLRVTEILASDPHPRWKILVLIYDGTDLTYTDVSGTHHFIGEIGSAQVAAAAANATRFVQTDIPALSSGNMVPELTIRYPGPLRTLTQFGNGWWPSPTDTAGERDPTFDSVIVIWQPTVIDQATGQLLWIGNAAGLTPPMGTGQTYATLIIEAATLYGHVNVFKHEWGHSLLDYYEAAGTSPTPTVTNHAVVNQYVHCPTGEAYVWLDETDANPIPTSIYSNESGFTHDYYSGTTALAADPMHCLGVTPAAWATGGPVSMPGELPIASPAEKIQEIRTLLQQLVKAGTLRRSWSRPLEAHLDTAVRAIAEENLSTATDMLTAFRGKVSLLREKKRLPETAAAMLIRLADEMIQELEE